MKNIVIYMTIWIKIIAILFYMNSLLGIITKFWYHFHINRKYLNSSAAILISDVILYITFFQYQFFFSNLQFTCNFVYAMLSIIALILKLVN